MFVVINVHEIRGSVTIGFFESVVIFMNDPVEKGVDFVFHRSRKREVKGKVFIDCYVLVIIMFSTTSIFSNKLYGNTFLADS